MIGEFSLRAVLEHDLAERLDRPEQCPILLALHVGCGANALGISGHVEPRRKPEPDQEVR